MSTADEPPRRDVKNHILFECAWEVANKGGTDFPVFLSRFSGVIDRGATSLSDPEFTQYHSFGDTLTCLVPLTTNTG